ncbi:MAG TPA: WecB/TagA/CpsF family glycosyltransferase [Burkholderiales bacterium]|nr:WecB/TagA/CpsF family glycosyltransferase [Burkholderiales bacterium]
MRTDAAALPDFGREVHCLLGLPFDAVDLAGAEARIRSAASTGARCFLSTPNVNFLINSRVDPAFRMSVINSDLSVADGMPVVWLARLLGIPMPGRVAGASLFESLRSRGAGRLSVYFFGGPDGAGEVAWRKLSSEADGGLKCVGFTSPGFGSVEEMSRDELIERINAARPDLLVVALGARKGQAWIERNRARLNVPVISHLGAVLEFAAGATRRAPVWVQTAGLEWLWRIKERPALWRRYFADGIALARLLFTRVLPYAWYQRRNAPDELQLAYAGLEMREEGPRSIVYLRGTWTRHNLARLRRCCHHAALAGRDLRLDLSEVTYVDSAFVGLLMVVEAHQRRLGRRLVLLSVARPVRRVMRYCCAEYLLAAD